MVPGQSDNVRGAPSCLVCIAGYSLSPSPDVDYARREYHTLQRRLQQANRNKVPGHTDPTVCLETTHILTEIDVDAPLGLHVPVFLVVRTKNSAPICLALFCSVDMSAAWSL